MSKIDFSLSPKATDIVRILGVSSENAANTAKSDIISIRELGKFLSREETNTWIYNNNQDYIHKYIYSGLVMLHIERSWSLTYRRSGATRGGPYRKRTLT